MLRCGIDMIEIERVQDGIDLDRHFRMGRQPLDPITVRDLTAEGMVVEHRGRLATTAAGRLVLNGVIRRLLNA